MESITYMMQPRLSIKNMKKDVLASSNFYIFALLFALVLAFYSRIPTAYGAPDVLNFAHYGIVSIIGVSIMISKQTKISVQLFFLTLCLFGSIVISTFNSQAGIVNFALDSVILAQPFMFLYIMISKEWSEVHINKFRKFIFSFVMINAAFAFFEFFILGHRTDDVKGVFLNMGAGHHVAGAIALSSIIYGLFHIKKTKVKIAFITIQFLVTVFVDNKQSLAVFLISLIIITLFNFYKIKKMLIYSITIVFFIILVQVMMDTIFPQLHDWMSYGKSFGGLEAKLKVFDIIKYYQRGIGDRFFGLGPGHSVGRLAQMLPDYYGLLSKFGATIHPATAEIWHVQQSNWITNAKTGSSMWSLLFSWCGIYGDLGILGLVIYSIVWIFIYRKLCFDNYSKFLVISVIVHGAVFQWMEEPAYMLFVICLIGLKYHEHMLKKRKAVEAV